ncbi:MAG: threonylcarbamoyl-AMP synthase [Cyanobacteria bacterium HKST-UBA03]|nr:threonylcarbamoyl-AMP synthase [Cyanobacteria bacterium HKST-UBA03]
MSLPTTATHPLVAPTACSPEQAVDALQQGLLVVLPTETVYGLAANACNEAALAHLFAVKGRPETHPVIVHIASAEALDDWAVDIPDEARQLAAAFWPGPLTLILKKAGHVPSLVTGGQDTVGLRCPSHPVFQQILAQSGLGLAAPSANPFQGLSPTLPTHVRLPNHPALAGMVDGGPCPVGIESTIVDCSGLPNRRPTLLRPGHITPGQLQAVLGYAVSAPTAEHPTMTQAEQPEQTVRAPGSHARHYAPQTACSLVTPERLDETLHRVGQALEKIAVVSRGGRPASLATPAILAWETMPTSPAEYARHLFDTLHRLDQAGHDIILIEAVPDDDAWQAVDDRLQRACSPGSTGSPSGTK